jgi:tetratricopeptide (TPR) repeat protein
MKAIKILAVLSALLVFSVQAAAQIAPAAPIPTPRPVYGSINGRILLPNGRPVTEAIKITLRQLRGDRTVLYTDSDGSFQLSRITPGTYTVEAEADRERKYELTSERVDVMPDFPSIITIYLKEKAADPKEKPPGGESVSAAELDVNVPGSARKEFERGAKAGREGRNEEAAAHMRKALAIYPEYLMARNDLGTYLLALGQLEEATETLEEAIKLAPKAFNPRLNLGIVLVRRHEFADAAENLDVALSLDPRSPAAHLYAGLARLGLGDSVRAEKEFVGAYELGGSQFALAQFHLGQLYMDRGERASALRAFETYLRDKPDAADAEQVKRLIGILR